MRAFSQTIENQGFIVKYFKLDDADNAQSFERNILNLIQRNGIQNFEYQLPDEYRLDVLLKNFACKIENTEGVKTKLFDTEHFLSVRDDLATLFKGKKTYLMETFYRKMRVKYNILMEIDGKTPLSNRWNFDAENRQKLHKTITIPQPLHFFRDVSEMVSLLKRCYETTAVGMNKSLKLADIVSL